jgi:hypothetical protein
MKKLLIATVALVTVFSMPASAALTGRGPRLGDIPDVSRNTEASPEHHQLPSNEQWRQDWDAAGQVNDPYSNSSSNGSTND